MRTRIYDEYAEGMRVLVPCVLRTANGSVRRATSQRLTAPSGISAGSTSTSTSTSTR